MKKKIVFLIFIFSLVSVFLSADENNSSDWKFDDEYKATRIFLHNFLNYDFHPLWEFEYEKSLLKKNQSILSFGSTHVKDLSNKIKLNINEELGNGWWFRSNFYRHQTQYKNEQEQYLYLGFEKRIYKQLSVFSMCNAGYDKEFIDLDLGLALMDDTNKKYFRLAFSYDDFLYDEKNQSGGKVTGEPVGISWKIRFGKNKFQFFSEGKYIKPFQIKYQNPELSPELYLSETQSNNLTAKLYYFFKERTFTVLRFQHYVFWDKKKFYEPESNYSYLNEIDDIALKIHHRFNDKFALRPVIHYVIQNAAASGLRNYDFKRWELISAFYLEYFIKKTMLETGLLGTTFNSELDDMIDLKDYDYANNDLKFFFSWTYNFTKRTRLKFSVSHVFDIHGFGGGNLQYMMVF